MSSLTKMFVVMEKGSPSLRLLRRLLLQQQQRQDPPFLHRHHHHSSIINIVSSPHSSAAVVHHHSSSSLLPFSRGRHPHPIFGFGGCFCCRWWSSALLLSSQSLSTWSINSSFSTSSSVKKNQHPHNTDQQHLFFLSTTADTAAVAAADPRQSHHRPLIDGICYHRSPPRSPLSSSLSQSTTIKMGSITQLTSVAHLHTDNTVPPPSVAPPAPLTLEPLLGPDVGILVARINVPSTRNAFSRALAQAFRDMVDQLRYGHETRALILTSSVPQAFCSGVDLKERRKMSSNEVYTFVDGLRRTITDLSELPFPTIACIDGCALGGGLELALACDIRIATQRSELGLPETRLAIIPGCGGTQRLPRVVGVAKAKELILTGRKIRGDEAAQIGLLNHLTDDPYAKALEIARDVLKTGPLANRVAKLAVEQGFDLELRSGLVVEQQCYAQLMPTKDRLEALDAFAQKRPPKFKGE